MNASDAKTKLERFDQWQQHRRWSAVPTATVKKYGEDKSTNLAAMIAFWAFFSVFPLLMAFVTIAAYVVPSSARQEVFKRILTMLPVLDPSALNSITGSWWVLVLGIGSALWSGSAVVRTTQFAFNSVWEIPYHERPKLGETIKRSLLVLSTIGVGLVVSTIISSFVTSTASGLHLGFVGHIVGYAIAIVLDVGLFIAAFRMLTDRDISTRDVLPGAVLSGLVFWVLQQASSLIISRYLQNAQSTYGHFATVITMLWWFYLQGMVTLLGAQLNVVLKQRMWPRSLVGGPDTPADHNAYSAYAQERTYHDNQRVDTTFVPDGGASSARGDARPAPSTDGSLSRGAGRHRSA